MSEKKTDLSKLVQSNPDCQMSSEADLPVDTKKGRLRMYTGNSYQISGEETANLVKVR